MADEAQEVSPFSINKNFKSTAPRQQTNGEQVKTPSPDDARPVVPIMFTKPGEDFYTSDDPDASPIYSDFRAAILPADSDVPAGVEVADIIAAEEPIEEGEDEEPVDPKASPAPGSVDSSASPVLTVPVVPATPVLPDDLPQTVTTATETEPASGLDADKGSTPPKESESSTPTSSSTQVPKSGSSTPPA